MSLHFINNRADDLNLLIATSGSDFWLHWNSGPARLQAKAKRPEHVAVLNEQLGLKHDDALEAYTVQSLLQAAEDGTIDWRLLWPDEPTKGGIAIQRTSTERRTQAHAKGF